MTSKVRLVAESAQPVDRAAAAPAAAPAPAPAPEDGSADGGQHGGDGNGNGWQGFLPEDFPVRALGVQGRTCYLLDELGQMQDLTWKELERKNIEGLMGRQPDLLERFWPRKDDKGRVKGWRAEDAARDLKASCAYRGVWSPEEMVRGAGAWKGEDGELIMHYGSRIIVYPADGGPPVARDPGMVGDLVFPTRPILPQPATAREAATGVGAEILADFRTWNFRRPQIDPELLLGHMVAIVLGGALAWRPLHWLTGTRETGKSTLQKYLGGALTRWLVASTNASAAGVWQKLGWDSRGVSLDEAEPGEDGASMNTLIKLAREAASGGVMLRGGSDHTGREFTTRSTFGFSSITVPTLNSADRSRMAISELMPLPAGAVAPNIKPKRLEQLGRRLLRRIVDQWPRFAVTLEAYRGAMERAGHKGRGQDVFGTLLACHHLALYDHPPDKAALDTWSERLKAGDLAELVGDLPIEQACLLYLLTQRLEAYRGGSCYTVGEWVRRASDFDSMGPTADAKLANDVLRSFGLEVKMAPREKGGAVRWPGLYLWVANRHTALAKLWERTQWRGGVDTVGGWVQHLGRLPGAHGNVPYWCGAQTKAVLVPYLLCLEGPAEGGHDNTSAAGGSPGTESAREMASDEASHRRAADTVQGGWGASPDRDCDPDPDPFALRD